METCQLTCTACEQMLKNNVFGVSFKLNFYSQITTYSMFLLVFLVDYHKVVTFSKNIYKKRKLITIFMYF